MTPAGRKPLHGWAPSGAAHVRHSQIFGQNVGRCWLAAPQIWIHDAL